MAKKTLRLRGPTRSLRTRLEESKNRTALLENRTLKADLDKDAADLRRKLFRRDSPTPKND